MSPPPPQLSIFLCRCIRELDTQSKGGVQTLTPLIMGSGVNWDKSPVPFPNHTYVVAMYDTSLFVHFDWYCDKS